MLLRVEIRKLLKLMVRKQFLIAFVLTFIIIVYVLIRFYIIAHLYIINFPLKIEFFDNMHGIRRHGGFNGIRHMSFSNTENMLIDVYSCLNFEAVYGGISENILESRSLHDTHIKKFWWLKRAISHYMLVDNEMDIIHEIKVVQLRYVDSILTVKPQSEGKIVGILLANA